MLESRTTFNGLYSWLGLHLQALSGSNKSQQEGLVGLKETELLLAEERSSHERQVVSLMTARESLEKKVKALEEIIRASSRDGLATSLGHRREASTPPRAGQEMGTQTHADENNRSVSMGGETAQLLRMQLDDSTHQLRRANAEIDATKQTVTNLELQVSFLSSAQVRPSPTADLSRAPYVVPITADLSRAPYVVPITADLSRAPYVVPIMG